MSTKYKGLFGGVILGLSTLAVCALVAIVVALMQEPPESPSTGATREHEIVRLPEDLTADFKYSKDGWWIANGPADDNAVRRLAKKHPIIRNVCLNQAAVSAKGYEALSGHHLYSLDLIDSDIDANIAKVISRFSGLKVLLLKDRAVSDGVMTALTGPKSLETLFFRGASITHDGLRDLPSKFPELKSLTMVNCEKIDDSVVPILMDCRKLKYLSLIATPVSAEGAAQLVKHLPIIHFGFEYAHSEQAAELLEKLPDAKLRLLSLNGNRLDEKIVSRLATMKHLKTLVLAQCPGLTSQHIALLKKKLPGCDVSLGDTEQEPEIGLVDE